MTCQTLGPTPGASRSGVLSPMHLGPAHGSGQRGPCLVSGLERGGVRSPPLLACLTLTPRLAWGLVACCLSGRGNSPEDPGAWAAG